MHFNHITEPLLEPKNRTQVGFLLLKIVITATRSCFRCADCTNTKQGKRGDEFHSGGGGGGVVVTVSALSKCCSCCQMTPGLPSASPSLG